MTTLADRFPARNEVPIKSGFGPVTWFQTHNVAYERLSVRQWFWIIWHYISAFGVMYAVLSWLQESEVIPSSPELQGWKGVLACLIGIVLYFFLPHRMVHFHDPIPYSNYVDAVKLNAWNANAKCVIGSLGEVEAVTAMVRLKMEQPVSSAPRLVGPKRSKSGLLPEWFETHNVPYTYLTVRQWFWIIWHYISAFGVMYAVLSWLQECTVIEKSAELKGMKGVMACLFGCPLYWLLPHRMYHFHDAQPATSQSFAPIGSSNTAHADLQGQAGVELQGTTYVRQRKDTNEEQHL